MFALHEAYRTGYLAQKHWMRNIIAGVIVGIVALPLAMAFAIASGVKPEQGLYTAIVAGFAVSIFGGSRVQIAGPTGAFIVILSGISFVIAFASDAGKPRTRATSFKACFAFIVPNVTILATQSSPYFL